MDPSHRTPPGVPIPLRDGRCATGVVHVALGALLAPVGVSARHLRLVTGDAHDGVVSLFDECVTLRLAELTDVDLRVQEAVVDPNLDAVRLALAGEGLALLGEVGQVAELDDRGHHRVVVVRMNSERPQVDLDVAQITSFLRCK